MRLGPAGTNAMLENAVCNSIADGVTYATASGNSNADACTHSPRLDGPPPVPHFGTRR